MFPRFADIEFLARHVEDKTNIVFGRVDPMMWDFFVFIFLLNNHTMFQLQNYTKFSFVVALRSEKEREFRYCISTLHKQQVIKLVIIF